MSDPEKLREYAASLRAGFPPMPLIDAALRSPPPAGGPHAVRETARVFQLGARHLDDASVDLDDLRQRQLPKAWVGDTDTSAAEMRLRASARHAEHACEVFGRVSRCLDELARQLEAAQHRDSEARQQILATAEAARTVPSDELEALALVYADQVDELADAVEQAQDGAAEAASELRKYAGEAGSMWLTRPQSTAGIPSFYVDDRMPPEEILLRYHQADDPDGLVEFSRLGRSRQMTATEARMLDELKPWELLRANGVYNDAYSVTGERFPEAADHDTDNHVDAFRHAYFSARLTREFGEEWAEEFGTAHEGWPFDPPTPLSDAMDLHNNEVGRQIALENPDASNEELAGLIDEALRSGRLVVLDDADGHEQLVYSDQVSW